jgi:hypothetical protein
VLHFTREYDSWRDTAGHNIALFGRAHPLVLRAIRHGCRLPGAVAASRYDRPGLLLTFQSEIAAAHQVVFRHIIAVIAHPNCPVAECTDWLAFGTRDDFWPRESVWDRLFSPWVAAARSAADLLVGRIASARHTNFVAEYHAGAQQEATRSQHWLRVKADQLCGTFKAPTGDLFGEPEPGPMWRRQADPSARLVSFAIDRDVPVSKRREANDTLETFRAMQAANTVPGPIVSRPIGMLMLVPRDAF